MDWLKLFAAVFTAAMMFSAGAAISEREIRRVAADRNLLVRAYVANIIVVPLLAWMLAHAFHLRRDVALGAVLAAICPGAPFGTYMAGRSRRGVALAVILTCGLTFSSLVTTPITSLLIFGPGKMVSLPPGRGLLITLLIVLLPVLIAQAARRLSPEAAMRLGRAAGMLAFAALIAGSAAAAGLRSRGVRMVGWSGSALILSLVLVSMAVGWLFGKSPESRATLATSTGLRNVGLAYLFAEYSFPDSQAQLGVAAYSILMLLPNFTYTMVTRRRATPAQ